MKTETKIVQKLDVSLKSLMELPALLLVLLFVAWTFLSLTTYAQTSGPSTSRENLKISKKNDIKHSDFDGSWNLSLMGVADKNEFNQATLTRLKFDLTGNYQLADWVKLNVSPSLKSVSGHAQTEKEIDANKDSISLRNASANFILSTSTSISAGALQQSTVHSPLLIGERAFPAVRVHMVPLEANGFHAGLFAQSAVPTSNSLSTETKEFEPTPSFQSGGVIFNFQNSDFTWKNSLTGFEYKNLPLSVSNESGLLGNTVAVTNSTDTKFIYAYRGMEAGTDLKINWNHRITTNLTAIGIQNSAAPKGLNQGYLLLGSLDYMVSPKFTLTPHYEYFRVEPDSTVAAYSSSLLDTNRVGYKFQLQGNFSRRFSLRVAGGEREVIYQSAAQSRERFYELGLETVDAKF